MKKYLVFSILLFCLFISFFFIFSCNTVGHKGSDSAGGVVESIVVLEEFPSVKFNGTEEGSNGQTIQIRNGVMSFHPKTIVSNLPQNAQITRLAYAFKNPNVTNQKLVEKMVTGGMLISIGQYGTLSAEALGNGNNGVTTGILAEQVLNKTKGSKHNIQEEVSYNLWRDPLQSINYVLTPFLIINSKGSGLTTGHGGQSMIPSDSGGVFPSFKNLVDITKKYTKLDNNDDVGRIITAFCDLESEKDLDSDPDGKQNLYTKFGFKFKFATDISNDVDKGLLFISKESHVDEQKVMDEFDITGFENISENNLKPHLKKTTVSINNHKFSISYKVGSKDWFFIKVESDIKADEIIEFLFRLKTKDFIWPEIKGKFNMYQFCSKYQTVNYNKKSQKVHITTFGKPKFIHIPDRFVTVNNLEITLNYLYVEIGNLKSYQYKKIEGELEKKSIVDFEGIEDGEEVYSGYMLIRKAAINTKRFLTSDIKKIVSKFVQSGQANTPEYTILETNGGATQDRYDYILISNGVSTVKQLKTDEKKSIKFSAVSNGGGYNLIHTFAGDDYVIVPWTSISDLSDNDDRKATYKPEEVHILSNDERLTKLKNKDETDDNAFFADNAKKHTVEKLFIGYDNKVENPIEQVSTTSSNVGSPQKTKFTAKGKIKDNIFIKSSETFNVENKKCKVKSYLTLDIGVRPEEMYKYFKAIEKIGTPNTATKPGFIKEFEYKLVDPVDLEIQANIKITDKFEWPKVNRWHKRMLVIHGNELSNNPLVYESGEKGTTSAEVILSEPYQIGLDKEKTDVNGKVIPKYDKQYATFESSKGSGNNHISRNVVGFSYSPIQGVNGDPKIHSVVIIRNAEIPNESKGLILNLPEKESTIGESYLGEENNKIVKWTTADSKATGELRFEKNHLKDKATSNQTIPGSIKDIFGQGISVVKVKRNGEEPVTLDKETFFSIKLLRKLPEYIGTESGGKRTPTSVKNIIRGFLGVKEGDAVADGEQLDSQNNFGKYFIFEAKGVLANSNRKDAIKFNGKTFFLVQLIPFEDYKVRADNNANLKKSFVAKLQGGSNDTLNNVAVVSWTTPDNEVKLETI